jgi:peptidoglycan/xylan/chitin deacetylase (PgdA/CDA1 family)
MASLLGILKQEFGWQQILEQEGILYQVLSIFPSDYSAPIIVNRQLDKSEIPAVQTFLKNGGAILTDFPNLASIIDNFDYKPSKISYLLNDDSDTFNNIAIIDLHLDGYKSKSKIYQNNYGKGFIIALPFDVNQTMCDTRNERKPFYYPSRKFPNEVVSKASKGEVRKLAVNCIRKLFAKMNLPYLHLWYYPNQYQSAFAFRVDTDDGPEDSLRATFDLEEKSGIKFTYFVNTKVHPAPMYIGAEKEVKEDDINEQVSEHRCGARPTLTNNQRDFQIHCFEHKVFKDYQTNYNNIKKAKTILENSGTKPIGFVSPFGFWNENLQKAMEDLNIEYSSEFSLAYDDLPFYPILENRRSSVLQIPVHPVCIGRLVHASLTKENRIDYYNRYFFRQLQANEPIFIYDHPHRIAQFPDIFSEVLNNAKKLPDIWLTDMTEFYYWWKARLSTLNKTKWRIENQSLKVETLNQDSRLYLHIITPNNKQTFIPLKQTLYNLKDLSYKSIVVSQKICVKDYMRLKSKRTKLQMKFYQTVDKTLKLFGG